MADGEPTNTVPIRRSSSSSSGVSGFPPPAGVPAPPPPPPPPQSNARRVIPPPVIPAAPPVGAGEVTIRTMRDDITDVQSGRRPPRASQEPAAVTTAPTTVATTGSTAEREVFPLPPKEAAGKQKVVLAPGVRRRTSHRGLFLALALGVILLGGAGAVAWYYLPLTGTLTPTTAPLASVTNILPAGYSVIVQYRLSSAQDRTDIHNAWQARTGTPSVAELLAGDPRPLLEDAQLTEMYYVLLEDSVKPYLVVPKTARTTEIIVTRGEARVVEHEGWYIAHALTVDPYAAALRESSLAAIGAPPLLTDATVAAAMRLYLGAGIIPDVRTDVAGNDFAAGVLQELQLAARPHAAGGSLEIAGRAVTLGPLGEATTNQQLLSLVPAEATLARLGANFADDLEDWRGVAGVLDDAALNRPIVRQELAKLTTPYAYFHFPNTDGSTAMGIIIELPTGGGEPLTLDTPALAEGIPALVPLIIDRRTVAPLTFTDVPYGAFGLRFANIVGTSQALDYTVTPTHILIATSKESMLALLDTVAGDHESLETGGAWQNLVRTWGALPAARDLVLGTLTLPQLVQLLPTAPQASNLPFGLLTQADPVQAKVSGVIELSVVAQPSPTSSLATPSPTAPLGQ